jgi:hypothetical protein
MMRRTGRFEFNNEATSLVKTIEKSTMWLLLEAHRLVDENARMSGPAHQS